MCTQLNFIFSNRTENFTNSEPLEPTSNSFYTRSLRFNNLLINFYSVISSKGFSHTRFMQVTRFGEI